MNISEIFQSIQGEGKLAGVPSVFIRTSGCNLRCSWCDSPYTSWEPQGQSISLDDIMEKVAELSSLHVVITGGEPMIDSEIVELTQRLRRGGYHITIETAATVWRDGIECDLASISPKLANSTPWTRQDGKHAAAHEKNRINIDTIRRFMAGGEHQIKFVVADPEDMAEIDTLLTQIGNHEMPNILLMPLGVTPEELAKRAPFISDICKKRGYRYCPRLHIELYGNTRGT